MKKKYKNIELFRLLCPIYICCFLSFVYFLCDKNSTCNYIFLIDRIVCQTLLTLTLVINLMKNGRTATLMPFQ